MIYTISINTISINSMPSNIDIILVVAYLNSSSLDHLEQILTKESNANIKNTTLSRIVSTRNILKQHTIKINLLKKFNPIIGSYYTNKMRQCNHHLIMCMDWQ